MAEMIIAVTPAGRKHYLELLRHYVCSDPAIAEWHLWDNCRTEEDRIYLDRLASEESKVRIIRVDRVDGTNRSINKFYAFCVDDNAFYIRIDDDVVYLPKGFAQRLYEKASAERQRYIWWSPLVINNAVSSFLVKHFSQVEVPEAITCQCFDQIGWMDPFFAESIHKKFLDALEQGTSDRFCVADFAVSLSRYSVNCIGFFGSEVKALGQDFCPKDVDEEEWISAVLPARLHRPGCVVGSLVVAHFSFFTQEPELLETGLLERYYKIAGLTPAAYKIRRRPLRQRLVHFAWEMKRNLARS
jgi:hypothetical protein